MLRCMRRQLKRLDGIFSAATRLTPGPQFRSSMVVLDGERRAGGDPIRPIGFAAPGGRTTLGRASYSTRQGPTNDVNDDDNDDDNNSDNNNSSSSSSNF
ncbi:hypothetical protein VSDG_02530 [Cytospora chrysosperma]|uniref:Uncharacterized protein n=1 Tax=Cytospora chrysosperma TaxID=252740 RepID=A0A423WFR0_CYTCH|nr:hypothetical protein VSDG_02530 [Valsa sordida]